MLRESVPLSAGSFGSRLQVLYAAEFFARRVLHRAGLPCAQQVAVASATA